MSQPDAKSVRYGVYSSTAAKLSGSCFYRRPDGTEVEVTGVYRQSHDRDYGWSDACWIGEVTDYIREGQPRQNLKLDT